MREEAFKAEGVRDGQRIEPRRDPRGEDAPNPRRCRVSSTGASYRPNALATGSKSRGIRSASWGSSTRSISRSRSPVGGGRSRSCAATPSYGSPSSLTPLVSIACQQIFHDVTIDTDAGGVFALAIGSGPRIGESLLHDPHVLLVHATGSCALGDGPKLRGTRVDREGCSG